MLLKMSSGNDCHLISASMCYFVLQIDGSFTPLMQEIDQINICGDLHNSGGQWGLAYKYFITVPA